MNKTIQINPNHFTFNSTRKRKQPEQDADEKEHERAIKIKMKSEQTEQMNRDRLIKSLLKRQEKNFKMRERSAKPINQNMVGSQEGLGKSGEFHESVDYLLGLKEAIQKRNTIPPLVATENWSGTPTPSHIGNAQINTTIKHYHRDDPPVYLDFPENPPLQLPDDALPIKPLFGCLKHGTLPTYRQYKQQLTQKNYSPSLHSSDLVQNHSVHSIPTTGGNPTLTEPLLPNNPIIHSYSIPTKPLRKPIRQRKCVRRTHKVGRSETHPHVSVLLSNKTIRKRVNNDKQVLRQTPMSDVKAFLIQRGLIKAGTTSPNDVLRNMYESASLTCGEVYNHNPDVLLYNFFHGNASTKS